MTNKTGNEFQHSAQPTINNVAALAGVSIKTVSRVVNKEPNVRPATREKVEQAIKQLSYQPNQSARSLAGNRSYLIGLLYANPSSSYIINAQMGALESCRQEGFGLLIHPCDYRSESLTTEVENLVRDSRLDGLILTPPLTDNLTFLEYIDKRGIAYTSVAPVEPEKNVPSVFSDDHKAAFDMTEYLIELGHSRIGFILGHPDHGATHARYQGYHTALLQHGIKENRSLIKQGYFDFESGKTCGLKLLRLKQPPTAIFSSNDYMAGGVMVAAQQSGVSVPEQLAIAGFDDVPLATQVWPEMTTIRQPIKAMVAKATELLIAKIRRNKLPETQFLLHCELIKRASTGRPL